MSSWRSPPPFFFVVRQRPPPAPCGVLFGAAIMSLLDLLLLFVKLISLASGRQNHDFNVRNLQTISFGGRGFAGGVFGVALPDHTIWGR